MKKNTLPASQRAGFTLIELLVTTSLAIFLMIALSTLFMTFMIGGTKVRLSQKVKTEGDFALIQMEYLLRNARELVDNGDGQICDSGGMDKIAIISHDNLKTVLQLDPDSNKIASVSAITDPPTNFYLSSDLATVTNFGFKCYQGQNDAYYIEINFTLKRGTGAENSPQTVIEEFSSGVTVRNF